MCGNSVVYWFVCLIVRLFVRLASCLCVVCFFVHVCGLRVGLFGWSVNRLFVC